MSHLPLSCTLRGVRDDAGRTMLVPLLVGALALVVLAVVLLLTGHRGALAGGQSLAGPAAGAAPGGPR